MQHILPVDRNTPGAAGAALDAVERRLGAVPNIYATIARSPAALEGVLGLSGALARGALDARVREQIALAVAGENGCDYCASAHTYVARSLGVAEGEARLNLAARATDPKVAALLGFARDIVRTRGRLDDNAAALDVLRAAGASEAEIVEVLAHVALNTFTNYFNHVAGTQIDFPPVSTAAVQSAA